MAFSGAAFASAPGFYVGAQGGWSNTNPDLSDLNGGGVTMTSGSTSGTGGAWVFVQGTSLIKIGLQKQAIPVC